MSEIYVAVLNFTDRSIQKVLMGESIEQCLYLTLMKDEHDMNLV